MKLESVPESRTYNTGDDGEAESIMDAFFDNTMDFLVSTYGLERRYFKREWGEIVPPGLKEHDNIVTYLKYDDVLVAVVMQTRTEFNWVRYDYARFSWGINELRLKSRN